MSSWREYVEYLKGGSSSTDALNDLLDAQMESFESSPSYKPNATVNGNAQGLLAIEGDESTLYEFITRPGDSLRIGDIIGCFDERWLVIAVFPDGMTGKRAIAQLCNYEFVFQTHDAVIHKYWGVFDSGNSKVDQKGTNTVSAVNKTPIVKLPVDEKTLQLCVDKRLCIGHSFIDHQKYPTVYKITGFDGIDKSSISNGELLILYLESDGFSTSTDNAELMICDYIATEVTSEIIGRQKIYGGRVWTYTSTNRHASWNTPENEDGLTFIVSDDNKLLIDISRNFTRLGAIFTISDGFSDLHLEVVDW